MEKKKYKGLTVNERLYLSDRIAEFDEAVIRKDLDIVVRILRDLQVDEVSISDIIIHLKISS